MIYICVSFSIQVQYEAEKHKKPLPGCPGGWNFQPLGSQTKVKKPGQRSYKDNIVNQFIEGEVIEVDQLEETNIGGHSGGPAQRDK